MCSVHLSSHSCNDIINWLYGLPNHHMWPFFPPAKAFNKAARSHRTFESSFKSRPVIGVVIQMRILFSHQAFFFFFVPRPFFFFFSLQRSVVSVVELLSAEASSLGELASLCNTWKNNDVHDTHVKDKKTKHIKLAGGRHKRSGRCQNAHPKKKKKKNRAQGFNAASRLVAVIKKKFAHMLHVPVHPLHPPSDHHRSYPSLNPTIWHTHRTRWTGIGRRTQVPVASSPLSLSARSSSPSLW